MKPIAVDVGNSATKLGFLADSNDLSVVTIDGDVPEGADVPESPATWAICSASDSRLQPLLDWIAARENDKAIVIGHQDIPLKDNLKSRSATGIDRLLGAWMAIKLANSDRPLILIDAGTAVTIDFVDERHIFQGGVIFPGATAKFRHLSAATSALPDLADQHRNPDIAEVMSQPIGDNTNDAILRGVYFSQVAAITEIVRSIVGWHGAECDVFATGGGVRRLRSRLPDSWNFQPDLLLRGAAAIGAGKIQSGQ